MKLVPSAFFSLLLSLPVLSHPLKMSYTAVKWEQGQTVISVEFRVFMDDIAVALQEEQRITIDPFNKASVQKALPAMTRYFARHFSLKVDGVMLPMGAVHSFRMSEFNGTTFLYHLPVKKLTAKEILVFNDILTAPFKEQQNMCQVRIADKKYAQKFTASHTQERIALQ